MRSIGYRHRIGSWPELGWGTALAEIGLRHGFGLEDGISLATKSGFAGCRRCEAWCRLDIQHQGQARRLEPGSGPRGDGFKGRMQRSPGSSQYALGSVMPGMGCPCHSSWVCQCCLGRVPKVPGLSMPNRCSSYDLATGWRFRECKCFG